MAGEKVLADTEKDKAFMKANSTGTRTYKIYELKDQQQIKAYFGKTRADLVKQIETLRAKQEEKRRQESDGVRKKVMSLTTLQLRVRCDALVAKHNQLGDINSIAALVEQFYDIVAAQDGKQKVGRLRLLMLDILAVYERAEPDIDTVCA